MIAARSPRQNPYGDRLIGTIRHERLDHVIVISKRHLRKILRSYFAYYDGWRTHQVLDWMPLTNEPWRPRATRSRSQR